MINEFVSFLTKANALALAIGVIIGGATGKVVSATIDFVIISFVVFLITKALLPKEPPAPPAPETKTCPECLETIPKAAKKCRACTSAVPV